MEIIRNSSEDEMILEFLTGELESTRFNKKLAEVLTKLDISENIIKCGNKSDNRENILRKKIMNLYRGYPNKELFNNFPTKIEWKFAKLCEKDIENIFYINYDYWNELSKNTSCPLVAAETIKEGREIFGVSNKQFVDGVEYLKNNKFPPVILITCNFTKFLIIEGHSRMTTYGICPPYINDTYAYIGLCSKEEMKKYDSRML